MNSKPALFFKKIFKKSGWFIILSGVLIAAFSGYTGYSKIYKPLDALYLTLQLFVLNAQSPVEGNSILFEIARWLAPLVTVAATIKAFFIILHDRLLLFALKFYHHHTIICGLGAKGMHIASDCIRDGEKIVLIDYNESSDTVSGMKEQGIVVLTENALQPACLKKARVLQADRVFALTNDDITNTGIAYKVFELKQEQNLVHKTKCYISINDMRIKNLVQNDPLFQKKYSYFEAQVFNVFEQGSRFVIQKYPPDANAGMAAPVHVCVVGFGYFGKSIVIQLARIAHYINLKKTAVTVIEKDASHHSALFKAAYPFIDQCIDLYFIDLDPEHLTDRFFFSAGKGASFTIIYFCMENDTVQFTTASQIKNTLMQMNIPAIICLLPKTLIGSLLESEEKDLEMINLRLFYILDQVLKKNIIIGDEIDRMAIACHKDYLTHEKKNYSLKVDQAKRNNTGIPEPKASMVDWEFLDENFRIANRSQADHIFVKIRAACCSLVPYDDPKEEYDIRTLASEVLEKAGMMEHNRWCADRWLAGWQYGEIRDDVKKVHNNLCPWEKLDRQTQQYDIDTILKIPLLLKEAGLKIVKAGD